MQHKRPIDGGFMPATATIAMRCDQIKGCAPSQLTCATNTFKRGRGRSEGNGANKMLTEVTASAPGSVMITGEHAVLFGNPAIVAAIDQRVTVQATKGEDGQVSISSQIAHPFQGSISQLSPTGPYRFVLAALALFAPKLGKGVTLDIRSEIDPTFGLGSSAAVVCATLKALEALTGQTKDLHPIALKIVRELQDGRGSGADLAASLMGGAVAYRLESGTKAQHSALPTPPTLSLGYAGYKTPTGEVLARVTAQSEGREAEMQQLYSVMGQSAERAISSAQQNNWASAAAHLNDYHPLMQRLGVSDAVLEGLIANARSTPGVMAAKISGSGLGDCVLAMGAVPKGFTPVEVAREGAVIHAQR